MRPRVRNVRGNSFFQRSPRTPVCTSYVKAQKGAGKKRRLLAGSRGLVGRKCDPDKFVDSPFRRMCNETEPVCSCGTGRSAWFPLLTAFGWFKPTDRIKALPKRLQVNRGLRRMELVQPSAAAPRHMPQYTHVRHHRSAATPTSMQWTKRAPAKALLMIR